MAVLDIAEPGSSELHYVKADITDDSAVRAAMSSVVETFGGLDILVNNAGIALAGGVEVQDDATWHRVFDVNVLGLVRVTRAALPRCGRQNTRR